MFMKICFPDGTVVYIGVEYLSIGYFAARKGLYLPENSVVISASDFANACHLGLRNTTQYLREILGYPSKKVVETPAMKWGRTYEKEAIGSAVHQIRKLKNGGISDLMPNSSPALVQRPLRTLDGVNCEFLKY